MFEHWIFLSGVLLQRKVEYYGGVPSTNSHEYTILRAPIGVFVALFADGLGKIQPPFSTLRCTGRANPQ